MTGYIIRRLLYIFPVWLGVIFITFMLFHGTRSPKDVAAEALGKNANPDTIADWIHNRKYGLPVFWNTESYREEYAFLHKKYPEEYRDLSWYDTQFFNTVGRFLSFDLGKSDTNGRPIFDMILKKIGPSLRIQIPAFFLTIFFGVVIALFVALYRGTKLDVNIVFMTVLLMSISPIVYLIGISYLNGRYLNIAPNYGTVLLPVIISVVASIGSDIRFYRTVFLDQAAADYTRTARSKGLTEWQVMYRHVLRNSLIPILTKAVIAIPFLITGSLLLEQFFGIPGLGDMFIKAIKTNDFAVVKAFVYIGSILYMLGTVLTDISYTLVDPRVVLK